jgi:hypothetical protein
MRSLIFLLLLSSQAFGSVVPQGTYEINNGTSQVTKAPFYGLYDYSQFGMIYTASEIMNAIGAPMDEGGQISSISLEFMYWSTNYTVHDQTIKISHTTASQIEGGPDGSGPYYVYPDYRHLTLTNTTVVKESFSWVSPLNESWETFDFTTNFDWNGQDNILISWENRDGMWNSGYGILIGGGNNRQAHSWYSDNYYPTRDSSYNSRSPNIRLTFAAVNPVPLPAGIYLFLSGLVGLGLMRGRNA